jgi:hypothetical protein
MLCMWDTHMHCKVKNQKLPHTHTHTHTPHQKPQHITPYFFSLFLSSLFFLCCSSVILGISYIWLIPSSLSLIRHKILVWLTSMRPNKNLKESDADTYTQTVGRNLCEPCGWIRKNLEEAEGEQDPVGRPAVSTNLEPCDLLDTERPTRKHTPAHMRIPTHIHQRPLWSGLSERRCT